MVSSCKNVTTVFRVGSERAYLPADFEQFTMATDFRFDLTEWFSITFFATEVCRIDARFALPLPDSTVLQGYKNTQIRAFINYENEQILAGIGAGMTISLPSAAGMTFGIAVPRVPQGVYPFGGAFPPNSGILINPGNVTSPPFPMPPSGLPGEPAPLPVYDTRITAYLKACRPPVGDRIARLSQQVFLETPMDPGPPPPNGDGDGDGDGDPFPPQ